MKRVNSLFIQKPITGLAYLSYSLAALSVFGFIDFKPLDY